MSEPLYVPKGTRDPHATSLIYEECEACEETGQNCPDHRYMQPESAANGPSETRQERIRRAVKALRHDEAEEWVSESRVADLLEAAATVGSYGAIAEAADRLARSLLGEPEVDR